MALYRYFKKAPSALPIPNGSILGVIPSEAISSVNLEMSELARQDTGQNSKTINVDSFLLHLESVLIHVLGFQVLDKVDMLKYEGVSAMLPFPVPTAAYRFCANSFHKI